MHQPNEPKEPTASRCPSAQGALPCCAPLAVPYVPFQQDAVPKYGKHEALAQGTLFPGLNLPLHLAVQGRPVPKTPLSELQMLSFVLTELGLYLDTHPKDQEAFRLFQQYAALYQEGRMRYEEQYGPLRQVSAAEDDHYTWLHDPWPWNYAEEG